MISATEAMKVVMIVELVSFLHIIYLVCHPPLRSGG